MLGRMKVVSMLSLSLFACGDDSTGDGGGGSSSSHSGSSTQSGHSSTTGTQASTATGSGSGSGSGSTGTTTSSTSSGGCLGDVNEPNETLSSPAFLNDAGNGLECGGNSVAGAGELADSSDIDLFKVYTQSEGCNAPAPMLTITPTAGLEVCFYVQDCDDGPALSSCPSGLTYVDDQDTLFASCCGVVDTETTIRLEDVVACEGFNFQLYVGLDASGSACNDYSLEVSL